MAEAPPFWMTEKGNPFDLPRSDTGPQLVAPKTGADTYDQSLRLDQSGLPTVGSSALTAAESTIFGVGEAMDILTLFKGAHTAATGDPATGKFMMAMGLGGLAIPMAAGAAFRKIGDALTMMVRRGELTPKEAAVRMAEKVHETNKRYFKKYHHSSNPQQRAEWLESQAEMVEDMRQTPDYIFSGRVPENFIEKGTRPGAGPGLYTKESEAVLPIHGFKIGYDDPVPSGPDPFAFSPEQLRKIEEGVARRVRLSGETDPAAIELIRLGQQREFETPLQNHYRVEQRGPSKESLGWDTSLEKTRSKDYIEDWLGVKTKDDFNISNVQRIEGRTRKRDPLMTAAEDEVDALDGNTGHLLEAATQELDDWLKWQESPARSLTREGRAEVSKAALNNAANVRETK